MKDTDPRLSRESRKTSVLLTAPKSAGIPKLFTKGTDKRCDMKGTGDKRVRAIQAMRVYGRTYMFSGSVIDPLGLITDLDKVVQLVKKLLTGTMNLNNIYISVFNTFTHINEKFLHSWGRERRKRCSLLSVTYL